MRLYLTYAAAGIEASAMQMSFAFATLWTLSATRTQPRIRFYAAVPARSWWWWKPRVYNRRRLLLCTL